MKRKIFKFIRPKKEVTKQFLTGLLLSGTLIAQNNYIPGLSPSAGNIGINLPSAPTEYNLQVRGSIGMAYGQAFGITNTGLPASQTKIFQTSWDATNSDYLAFFTPGGFGSLNAQEKLRIINNGNVGIGTSNPAYKLHIESNDTYMVNNPIYQNGFIEPTWSANYTKLTSTTKNGVHTALQGYDLNNAPSNFDGTGNPLAMGIGVFGKAERTITKGSSQSVGVFGKALGSFYNWGGAFVGDGTGPSITGKQANNGGSDNQGVNFGIWSSSKGTAAYFNGNTYSNEYFQAADTRFQDDVTPLTSAIEKLKFLQPTSFIFKTDAYQGLNLPEGKQMGINVQSLQEKLPELVKEFADVSPIFYEGKAEKIETYKAVNYTNLIPLLIAGIQEQQVQIEEQKRTNEDLRNLVEMQQQQINDLITKAGGTTSIHTSSDGNGFSMEQNTPNPFNNETIIKYNLPQSIGKANLVVYDLSGKQISSFQLMQKGSSSITLSSDKLAAGIYIYSIIVDGKVMDSKRMVVTTK